VPTLGRVTAAQPTSVDHRAIAVATYNRCWELLHLDERSDAGDDELLTCAFTSRYHWLVQGGDMQVIVADWMVSRAAAATGQADLAVRFAHQAFEGVQSGQHPAWLRASVFEGLARAYASAGDRSQRDRHVGLAHLVLDQEDDADDRQVIADQLATVPSVD
jgi:hypothetical protein